MFQLNEVGYVVIEDFLSPDEVDELSSAGRALCMDVPAGERKVFSTMNGAQNKENYFIESADKIRYFYEEGAIGPNGELLVDATKALNKVVFFFFNKCIKLKICFDV